MPRLRREHRTDCLSIDETGSGTPARLLPGLRAYPIIVRMFSLGSLLAGLSLVFTEPATITGWAADASGVVGGPRALGVVMVLAAALSFTGQCVERFGRVWGMILNGPLLFVAFAVLWGSVSTYFFTGSAGMRPSAGMVLGLSSGYFLTYISAYVSQEIRVRRMARDAS